MAECIYCRKLLPEVVPAEHVIPQAFGSFEPDLTISCVCGACNGFFGSTLEWPVRNSSTEGVLRLSHGGKGQVGGIGTRGIEPRIAESSEWRDARLVLKSDGRRQPYTDLVPQVGARKSGSEEWTWYLEKDLNSDFAAKYAAKSEFRIVGLEHDHERLEKRLIKVCPTFVKGGTMTPPIGTDGRVAVTYMNDFSQPVLRRFLTKIAFNFLALVRGADFALSTKFDVVRSFVRYGVEPDKGIVFLSKNSILAEEKLTGMRATNGHIVTVEGLPEGKVLEVQLSLFNSFKYRIILSFDYDGLFFASGLLFDVDTQKVTELIPSPVVNSVALIC